MVEQYPNRVVFTIIGNSYQNENTGNWIQGHTNIIEHIGRVEANGSGRMVSDTDGNRVDYSWMLYMPLPVETIPPGAQVEVYSGGQLICKTTVIRFKKGQLNARAWL